MGVGVTVGIGYPRGYPRWWVASEVAGVALQLSNRGPKKNPRSDRISDASEMPTMPIPQGPAAGAPNPPPMPGPGHHMPPPHHAYPQPMQAPVLP